MKKYFMLVAAALTAVAFVSCNKDDEENGGGGETGPVVFETTDATTVCINEVNGGTGYKGIELFNPTEVEITLNGYTIVKNNETGGTPYWTGTATDKIPAGGYLVILANKETGEIESLTNLSTNKGTGGLSGKKIVKLDLKNGSTVIDTFDRGWTKHWDGVNELGLADAETNSFARQQDGKKIWKVMTPTMGATNVGATVQGEVTVDPE